MITLITGDNPFESDRAVRSIIDQFDGRVQRIDGGELELRQLPDLLMGATLFADTRLIIIKHLSDNTSVWPVFFEWLPRLSDDIQIVLIEPKPDKRTVTYKELKKIAMIIETVAWTDRDTPKAEQWVMAEAKRMNVTLNPAAARVFVRRIGTDQWRLFHVIEKLQLVDTVTVDVIEAVTDASPVENVFNLFDAALRGDTRLVASMIHNLELSEDPYRLFGLLSGQAFQLAAVVARETDSNVAKDFAIHPYAVSKLESSARQLGVAGVKKVVMAFVQADDDIKLSRAEPWLLIERALLQVAAK